MPKLLTLLAVLGMLLGMAACKEKAPSTEPPQLAATEPVQTFEQKVERLRSSLGVSRRTILTFYDPHFIP